jgi:hypothetical protein
MTEILSDDTAMGWIFLLVIFGLLIVGVGIGFLLGGIRGFVEHRREDHLKELRAQRDHQLELERLKVRQAELEREQTELVWRQVQREQQGDLE